MGFVVAAGSAFVVLLLTAGAVVVATSLVLVVGVEVVADFAATLVALFCAIVEYMINMNSGIVIINIFFIIIPSVYLKLHWNYVLYNFWLI